MSKSIAKRYEINPPRTYLSFSGGRFRIIHHGSPINADVSTLAEALRAATSLKLTLADEAWNGDAGHWVHLNTIDEAGV